MLTFDLKRSLAWRVSLFALALLLVGTAWTVDQARRRLLHDLEHTGDTVVRLLSGAMGRSHTDFDRQLVVADLEPVAEIGKLAHFCAELVDVYRHDLGRHCFDQEDVGPAPLRWLLGGLLQDARFQGRVDRSPGIKFGELSLVPNLDQEAATVGRQLGSLLLVVLGILALNALIYVRVGRALKPSEDILRVLGRMEQGDLSVRMPPFALIELQRIGSVFNHMADRVQAAMAERQDLARHILAARDEERRHLARELHDECGQYLSSLRAEAAFAEDLAREGLPALLPCAQAINRSAAHLLESLQTLVRQLRPVGLEEFGLAASLEQLVESWNRRSDGACRYHLDLAPALRQAPPMDDNLTLTIYRVAQESLTNASRHSRASRVALRLYPAESAAEGGGLNLSVEDDGIFEQQAPATGFGLLGMRERVQALGGRLQLLPRMPSGLRVEVWLPWPAPEARP